jgi:hypothetical protein
MKAGRLLLLSILALAVIAAGAYLLMSSRKPATAASAKAPQPAEPSSEPTPVLPPTVNPATKQPVAFGTVTPQVAAAAMKRTNIQIEIDSITTQLEKARDNLQKKQSGQPVSPFVAAQAERDIPKFEERLKKLQADLDAMK